MELNSLVGAQAAPQHQASSTGDGEQGMSGVMGDEPFDTLDTFLRELQADLAESSQPSSTTPVSLSCRRQRYNIAAANPLLAGEAFFVLIMFLDDCKILINICIQLCEKLDNKTILILLGKYIDC